MASAAAVHVRAYNFTKLVRHFFFIISSYFQVKTVAQPGLSAIVWKNLVTKLPTSITVIGAATIVLLDIAAAVKKVSALFVHCINNKVSKYLSIVYRYFCGMEL